MSDYSFLDETSNGILVYVKYLGDNEITLEYDKNKKEASKFVCDYRKKVEVDLDEDDYQFLSNVQRAL
jgi:hypothetical protein